MDSTYPQMFEPAKKAWYVKPKQYYSVFKRIQSFATFSMKYTMLWTVSKVKKNHYYVIYMQNSKESNSMARKTSNYQELKSRRSRGGIGLMTNSRVHRNHIVYFIVHHGEHITT